MKICGLLFLLISLLGCSLKEEESSSMISQSDKYPAAYIPDNPIYYTGDETIDVKGAVSIDIKAKYFSDLPSPTGSYVFSKVTGPSWMSIDQDTGLLSAIPSQSGVFSFEVKVSDKQGQTVFYTQSTGELTIGVNTDPLYTYQWHLKNTGQDSFSFMGGTAGFDINVASVIEQGHTGKGVKIAISDSGGEINHDDLYGNIIDNASKDYTLDPPYLGIPVATSPHGTAVAGIIAAMGWNNIGGRGVAPEASIAIFQFLKSAQSLSILIDQASGDFDIFNYSYGDTLYFDTQSDADYIDHLRYQSQFARGAKGALYFKAAGNEFLQVDDYEAPSVCASHNANFPFENESPFLIVVGAINAEGERASYSNTGSNLWISAPGGEFGFNYPAIITTDLPTCFKGYSKASEFHYNDFEYNHELNPKCNYTSIMNGTSSAAPVAAGVAALILEANPDLTSRDVKHILAMTAKKVDDGPSFSNGGYGTEHPSVEETGCPSLSLADHVYEQGWVENNAGVKFSNAYGFGLIDVEAAVSLAKDFNATDSTDNPLDHLALLPMKDLVETNPYFNQTLYRRSVAKNIPDANANGVTDTLSDIPGDLIIETVQIKVQINHPQSGQIGIELTSPRGTKSILMNINNSFLIDNDQNLNIVLSTNAFYGESANDGINTHGDWTLKVIDGQEQSEGQLVRWDLNILGHDPLI